MIKRLNMATPLGECLSFKEKKKFKPSKFHKLYKLKEWQELRLKVLKKYPLCYKCLEIGRQSISTISDHLKDHKGDLTLFFDFDNIKGICKKCHNRKSAIERKKDVKS